MNIKKNTLLIKNREFNIEDIDIIKQTNGGVIIKNHNGSLLFLRGEIKLIGLNKELISHGYRNFLPIQHLLVNTDNLIGISNNDSDDFAVTLVFEKNSERIELSSKEELSSLGLKIQDRQSYTL